ncbi:TonB-dependent receptor plug domain-containing protein [Roseateles chitinivorans]|uniref:TonB-dependent receptor plug domain-containing protein n=1 Tax=Roseateles chitinivorans TaxID=2917965 RepID=UPI003D66FE98
MDQPLPKRLPKSQFERQSRPAPRPLVLPRLISLALGAAAFGAAHAQEAKTQEANQLDTVEVRGVRATLKKNLAEKREAQSIVDSISAEDVGKFPDKNVADSLQRVPGISVDRIWGRARPSSCGAPTRTST